MSTDTPEDAKMKLSRAMGAAFLAHQVSELERSVAQKDGNNRRPAPRKSLSTRPLLIVDTSVLVHALPVVKRWIREDSFNLIVPLEALSIIDMLKKSPAPLREQGHEATLFLESQFKFAKKIASEHGIKDDDVDPRIRLRAQVQHEEAAWDNVEKIFVLPENYDSIPEARKLQISPRKREQTEIPSASDLGRLRRSTLQALVYFTKKYPALKPKLVTHNPPFHMETSVTGQGFENIASGEDIFNNVTTYFPSLQAQPVLTTEIVAAEEWLKSQNSLQPTSSPKGRGKGRGGKNGRGPSTGVLFVP